MGQVPLELCWSTKASMELGGMQTHSFGFHIGTVHTCKLHICHVCSLLLVSCWPKLNQINQPTIESNQPTKEMEGSIGEGAQSIWYIDWHTLA